MIVTSSKVLAICLILFLPTCLSFHRTYRPRKFSSLSFFPTLATAQPLEKEILIVGGGVGGLAVAARIATTFPHSRITILEKNSNVGGRCGSFSTTIDDVGSFRHERGPSLLLLPDVYRSIFRDCSNNQKEAEDYGLNIKQCSPAYQVVFEDGDAINVGFPGGPSDTKMIAEEALSRTIMDSYESDGASKWDEYMRATSAFLDCGLPNFIEEKLDLWSFPNFLLEALRDYARAWPLKPHSDMLDNIFQSEKMKALASFQDLYVGLEPYRNKKLLGGGVLKSTAPAVFGLLAAIELHPTNKKSGVFAPVGGFESVTKALERLNEELGVNILCDKTVTAIEESGVHVVNTGSTESSSLKDKDTNPSKEFLSADLIVVNADLPYAATSLIQSKNVTEREAIAKFDWDDSFTYSSGVISFHWSINKSLDDLNTHNVFLMAGSKSQAELSWNILRTNTGNVEGDVPFNFYVHRASKTDPSAAPPDCDSIMVLVPCKTLLRDPECANLPRREAIEKYKEQFTQDVVNETKQAVFKRLAAIDSLKDLENHILDEVVDTPATWSDQFNVAAGTPFALSHGFAQLSLARPGQVSASIPNVLFCGASTRPGNGVPLVLIGAKQVAQKAVKQLREQAKQEVEELERREEERLII